MAELLARFAHSLLLTPRGAIPLDNDRQVASFARSTVIPLLLRGVQS